MDNSGDSQDGDEGRDDPDAQAGAVPAEGERWVRVPAERLKRLSAIQRALLSFRALSPLVKYLLEDLPRAIGASHAELRFHDPDGDIAELLTIRKMLGRALVLSKDSDPLYALYEELPETAIIGFDDERMFNILPGVDDLTAAVVMPVLDGNRLLGSFHLGFGGEESEIDGGCRSEELPLFDMLAQGVCAALVHVLEHESTERLTLVDPVTEVGNERAFRRDMQREISWARRVAAPLSLLYIDIDDLTELSREYGEVAGTFLQRRVSQRICSELRATDYMANLSRGQFAVLLPSCSEPHAHDISERMREDIERMAIDDGRGAVLHATLSIGMVCWEPARHPVESSERLSMQMESEALSAVQTAERGGGNQISVARIGLLML